jgi:hypothetical protein
MSVREVRLETTARLERALGLSSVRERAVSPPPAWVENGANQRLAGLTLTALW